MTWSETILSNMKRLRAGVWLLALMLVCVPVQAKWIQATGKAAIENGRLDIARQQAREDALRQAAMQAGVRVYGHQSLRNGDLTEDQLDIKSHAYIRDVKILDEKVNDDVVTMLVSALVEQLAQCDAGTANNYRKKVAIVGFSVQNRQHPQYGNLHNIDRALPAYLAKQLNYLDNTLVFETSRTRLYDDLVNAPTAFTQQRTLTKAVTVAKEMGVQFVLSGVIRDMSLKNPDAMNASPVASLRRSLGSLTGWGGYDQGRAFALEIFVHDGFNGSIVFQKFYRIERRWDEPVQSRIAFGSDAFWQTDYGQGVGDLLDNVAHEISERLRCQPFITRISRVDGRILHFSSGSSAGVRPGDKLSVYRTFQFSDSDQFQRYELTDMHTALKVDQVQPHFSRGSLTIEAGRLNIQEDDLLIAW